MNPHVRLMFTCSIVSWSVCQLVDLSYFSKKKDELHFHGERLQQQYVKLSFLCPSRDIEIGSVLLVEDPVVSCLYYDKRSNHCDNCLLFTPNRSILAIIERADGRTDKFCRGRPAPRKVVS